MFQIENARTEMPLGDGTDGTATFVDLACLCLNYCPNGASPTELRERLAIMKRLFFKDMKEQVDTIELTPEQFVKLKRLANERPWPINVWCERFLDALEAAGK